MPPDCLALKGREKPVDAGAEGQRLVISPFQGLLPVEDRVSFETQAVGLGFVSSPCWGSGTLAPKTLFLTRLEPPGVV